MEIGGAVVTTSLSVGHIGACKVLAERFEELVSVLPDMKQSIVAVRCATTSDGGYGSIEILAAEVCEITHNDWQEWAFSNIKEKR